MAAMTGEWLLAIGGLILIVLGLALLVRRNAKDYRMQR